MHTYIYTYIIVRESVWVYSNRHLEVCYCNAHACKYEGQSLMEYQTQTACASHSLRNAAQSIICCQEDGCDMYNILV